MGFLVATDSGWRPTQRKQKKALKNGAIEIRLCMQ
jgi:hypothetical protein